METKEQKIERLKKEIKHTKEHIEFLEKSPMKSIFEIIHTFDFWQEQLNKTEQDLKELEDEIHNS